MLLHFQLLSAGTVNIGSLFIWSLEFFIWVSKILILNYLKFIDNEKKSVINTFILP